MIRKSGASFKKTLKSRNEIKDADSYKITFKDEVFIQEVLNLNNYTTMEENKQGKILNWYGSRLNFIRIFYNKSVVELAIVIGRSDAYINDLQKNKTIPNKDILNKLSLLFEVPDDFFTDENITIRITEQFKIEYINESQLQFNLDMKTKAFNSLLTDYKELQKIKNTNHKK